MGRSPSVGSGPSPCPYSPYVLVAMFSEIHQSGWEGACAKYLPTPEGHLELTHLGSGL
jgi:hypothetical protein